MNRDDIIRMAIEAGFDWGDLGVSDRLCFERFAALVAEAERAARIAAQTEAVELKERLARSGVEERRAVAAEREACAQVAYATFRGKPGQAVNRAVAAAIRARGAA
jgi:hypothetical protein